MASAETWTIGRLLAWTGDYLRQHGSESPQLEAQLLLAHARRCRRIDLFTAYDEVVSESVRRAFRELVRQRARGAPVAYLTGRREFYALEFRVTPEVLIPRPESELLVLTLVDLARAGALPSRAPTIADVGTGSGILAVCAARHLPNCRVWATDISPGALAVAGDNCARHQVGGRVELFQGDLLSAVPPDVRFDAVLSNPPYVSDAEYAALPRDVRDHEPRLALLSGPTGTEVIARLIPSAAERLRPGGWLLCEVSPMIAAAVQAKVAADGRFTDLRTVPDLAGHPRLVHARRGS